MWGRFRPLALLGLGMVIGGAVAAQGALAQPATGTVTGRVVWGSCVRGVPLPMAPDAAGASDQSQPAAPDQQQVQPVQPGRPVPVQRIGLPAGAVLVAAQNTSVSARTDEVGRFTLSGVPAGQYLTIAAGPVASSNAAVADLPNVIVSGGQSTDIGTLALGGQTTLGIVCRGALDVPNAAEGAAPSEPGAPETVPATP